MPALKCPNPSCPLLFDPSQVPAGAVLTCPRCGMRFTLGPVAAPPAADAPAPAPASAPAVRPPRPARGGPGWLPMAAAVGVAGLLVAAVFVIRSTGTRAPAGRATEYRELNFAYRFPEYDWERDAAVQKEVGANVFGLRQIDGEARAALAASDFKTRMPQPGEIRDGITGRLNTLFVNLDAEPPEDGATWAGRPAVRVRFRGTARGSAAVFAGEAFALAYQGVGYWFFGWAPQADADRLLPEFAALRDRFQLLDYRTDWKERTSAAAVIAGNGADYRLLDGDRWWAVPAGAEPKKDEDDPAADLFLTAAFKAKRRTDNPPKATLVTVLLPAADDPLAAVRAHVRAKYQRVYGVTKWADVTDDPVGDPPAAGDPPATDTLRLKAGDGDTARLVVLSGVPLGDGADRRVVGAEAYCPWADREKWERRLVHLAGSLKAGR
jgi:hypothetical protein